MNLSRKWLNEFVKIDVPAGVDARHLQHTGVDHPRAQKLNPALSLTGGAARAAALVALYVHLAGGLGEGEVVGGRSSWPS